MRPGAVVAKIAITTGEKSSTEDAAGEWRKIMSKLEELIARLCPDGVEYKRIKDLCTVSIGEFVHKNFQNEKYPYPVFNGGTKETGFYNQYNRDENKIIISARGANAGFVNKVLTKFWAGNSCYTLDVKSESVDWVFIYYYLKSSEIKLLGDQQKGGIPAVSKKQVEEFKVPVPPLEVQREIVHVLDSFTLLTAELAAELAARQKQYEFYRDELLNTDENRIELKQVVKKASSGSTPNKKNIEYYEGGMIPWIRTQDVKFNEITAVDSFITEKAVQETSAKWIPENCVIVAISGATAGRCAINKIKATTNQHCLNMIVDESKALYKYVFYCVANQYEELIARKQGARGDLNSSLILSLKIPVPPLSEQQRIVDILDRFDALCNDITSGLPAEIEARKKQYEYYRDKLLTFKELKKEA